MPIRKMVKRKLTGTERMQCKGRDSDKPLFQENLHFTVDRSSSHFSNSKKVHYLHTCLSSPTCTQEMNVVCFVYHRSGSTLGVLTDVFVCLLSSYYVPNKPR